ncbi:lipoprotein-releasing ABC transporter permease subunit [Parahaliea sp. F7430]|uniref:Lipoprotein-releasing ABC transporter permease subunit n=1 Tax=Sediminihaliea albiluteola TaxID=2758564 RepID=A0A7W2TUI3_9GAMM|nr:lipoprotein-releasing ABC transporter permease subunit [Sediminihaliea albiluteola]MBA6412120.1 lipoprotein-releasing ABC transporter permease subunit [Sediminihaliea albiluteola]
MRSVRGLLDHYALFVGLRYSFSRKRNRFTSLIALMSMLGMVIGVASLITVLSVMNGFSAELRHRILSLVPHGYVESNGPGISDWRQLAADLKQAPAVLAVSPYISDKVIFGGRHLLRGGVLTAIDPQSEAEVSRMPESIILGSLDELTETPFSVVLGASLARVLGVGLGDRLEVTIPRLTVSPLGLFPRSKRLVVVALFEVGAEPDSYQAYVSLRTGQKLFGGGDRVAGLQLKTKDLFSAPQTLNALASTLPAGLSVRDWSQTQGSLFRAVKMEKIMVSLLLLSVVAVAAFNIVSTLVMSVAEKRRDIAVLRTMGARAGGVMAIFVAHGLGLAGVGIALGCAVGVLLASYIAEVTRFFEQLLGVKLFDPSVYFISELPSQLQWSDVVTVVFASFLLSLIATLYPAWRAAHIAPAEVLRYE